MSIQNFQKNLKKIHTTDELIKLCDNYNIINHLDEYEKNINILNEIYLYIEKNKINEKVIKLLEIPQPEQHSPEWFNLRKTCFTASSDVSIITQESYKHTKQQNINNDLMNDILILKKNGIEIEKFSGNEMTRWGNKYENIACKIYEDLTKEQIIEFGLLIHSKYPFIGASPDGISTSGTMLEIKCPTKRQITGIVPLYYWVQIQTQLQVCNLDKCDFIECNFEEVSKEIAKEFNGYKGIIYSGQDYIYPNNISIDLKYQKKYIKNKIGKTYNKKNLSYWILKKHSLVSVYRDDEWFNKHIKTIENTWNKVQYFKKNKQDLDELHKSVLQRLKKKQDEEYYNYFEE